MMHDDDDDEKNEIRHGSGSARESDEPRRFSDTPTPDERSRLILAGIAYALVVIGASFCFVGQRQLLVATTFIVVPAVATSLLPAMRGFAAGAAAVLIVGWLLLAACWIFAESTGLNDL